MCENCRGTGRIEHDWIDDTPCLACNRPASDPVHQWDADAELSNLTTEVTR